MQTQAAQLQSAGGRHVVLSPARIAAALGQKQQASQPRHAMMTDLRNDERVRLAHSYGRKFVAQTQNSAKPRGLVVFEFLVMVIAITTATYLLVNR